MASSFQMRTRGNLPARADPVTSLYRLFDEAFRGTGLANLAGEGQSGTVMMPKIDISETDSELKIRAEIPGVSEKDIEVILNGDMLTIRAERELEREEHKEDFHLVEMNYGTFQRSLQLPYRAEPDQVQARFENGILSVTIPKAKAMQQSNRIEVQGSSETQKAKGQEKEKAVHNGGGQKAQDSPQQQKST